jgi:hypothetical protein
MVYAHRDDHGDHETEREPEEDPPQAAMCVVMGGLEPLNLTPADDAVGAALECSVEQDDRDEQNTEDETEPEQVGDQAVVGDEGVPELRKVHDALHGGNGRFSAYGTARIGAVSSEGAPRAACGFVLAAIT